MRAFAPIRKNQLTISIMINYWALSHIFKFAFVSFVFPRQTDGRCLYGPWVHLGRRWWINLGRWEALTVNIDAGDEYIPARRETLTCAPRWWILITDATAVSSTDDCSPCRLSRKNWLLVDCWSDPDDCWWPAGSESDYHCWSKRDEFISICTQTGYYDASQ